MTKIVDVVNLNCDASCLAADAWLHALTGGAASRLCTWLRAYTELSKKVTLGPTGATIADIRKHNPEAIDLINARRDIFEVIVRPFSHDVALLRSAAGFALNLALGREIIEREFGNVCDFFLPAEFMLSNEQVLQLSETQIRGVFINATRFRAEVRQTIPAVPYVLEGSLGSRLECIPLRGELTEAYLDSLHDFGGQRWNDAIAASEGAAIGSWRDGESWFFLPDGEARELAWLEDEGAHVERQFVRDWIDSPGLAFLDGGSEQIHSYPVHSFANWFKEFRMLGYIARLQAVEERLEHLNIEERVLWLQAINSDVLSAVEKDSPVVHIVDSRNGDSRSTRKWRIARSGRGVEGEEFLTLLERWRRSETARDYALSSKRSHMAKFRARLSYLRVAESRGANAL